MCVRKLLNNKQHPTFVRTNDLFLLFFDAVTNCEERQQKAELQLFKSSLLKIRADSSQIRQMVVPYERRLHVSCLVFFDDIFIVSRLMLTLKYVVINDLCIC